jgi:alpha-beta hydrolase superfamily lysophospholipase
MILNGISNNKWIFALLAILGTGASAFLPGLSLADAKLQTIERREVSIELERNLLQTQGELTIPAVGDGPFPGVLLIHGSGATDRDEYLPPAATGTGNESRPFLQIAEYLSERGFVVLRYDKRGIGENGTILDLNTYANATVQQFQRDAEVALNFLMRQPEVDSNRITILGHSEGAIIAPRIAIRHSDDVQNVVLMSASAQTIPDLVAYQLINRTLFFAHKYWDDDTDSSLSMTEVLSHPDVPLLIPASDDNTTIPQGALNATNGSDAIQSWQWIPGLDTNNDTKIEIDEELLAFRQTSLMELESFPWFQSHTRLEPTLEIIDELRDANILVLQGEADIQTPIEHALLIEQRLTEVQHPDHTLMTYPGLGHTFYPADISLQPLGPMENEVLGDLHSWIKDPDRSQ